MSRSHIDDSSRDRLLAYVEGELTSREAERLEQDLPLADVDFSTLRALRSDCETLRSLDDATAPVGLIEDTLAGVERSMLLDEAPFAPLIQIRRRRRFEWRRLAAAAALVFLLSGAALMLLRNISFDIGDGGLDQIARLAEEEADRMRSASGVDPDRERPAIVEPGNLSTMETSAVDAESSEENTPTRESLATTDRRSEHGRVTVLDAPPPVESIDLGFELRVLTEDFQASLEILNQSLCTDGGGLVWNLVELSPAVLAREAIGVVALNGHEEPAWSGHPSIVPTRSTPRPAWNPAEYLIVGPNDLVPFMDQCAYGQAGFQVTLVGTPSQLLEALRTLDRAPGQRVNWTRRSADLSLEDLAIPPPLRVQERAKAMLWWLDPEENLALAQQDARSARPEPIIRIPVRLRPKRSAPVEREAQDRSRRQLTE